MDFIVCRVQTVFVVILNEINNMWLELQLLVPETFLLT
jgi:hypothetical protein